MVLADGKGIPLGVSLHAASPAEVKLANETIEKVGKKPKHWFVTKLMIPISFAASLKNNALSLWSRIEPIAENQRPKMAELLDVTNAGGKLNARLPASATIVVLSHVGNITTECIKLFSISLVL